METLRLRLDGLRKAKNTTIVKREREPALVPLSPKLGQRGLFLAGEGKEGEWGGRGGEWGGRGGRVERKGRESGEGKEAVSLLYVRCILMHSTTIHTVHTWLGRGGRVGREGRESG